MTYPKDWPRCPKCGDYAMDGHITCGRFECNEGRTRRERTSDEGGLGRFTVHEWPEHGEGW